MITALIAKLLLGLMSFAAVGGLVASRIIKAALALTDRTDRKNLSTDGEIVSVQLGEDHADVY
ncbi:MAG: hypothetical protein QM808_10235 [Steroidobacteraceae bacterium]